MQGGCATGPANATTTALALVTAGAESDDAQLSTARSLFVLAVVLSLQSGQAARGNDGSPDDDDCLLIHDYFREPMSSGARRPGPCMALFMVALPSAPWSLSEKDRRSPSLALPPPSYSPHRSLAWKRKCSARPGPPTMPVQRFADKGYRWPAQLRICMTVCGVYCIRRALVHET